MDDLVVPQLSKTARILALLAEHPNEYTAFQVSKHIKCSDCLVRKVAEDHGLQLRMSAFARNRNPTVIRPPNPEALERLRRALEDNIAHVAFVEMPPDLPKALRYEESRPTREEKAKLELVRGLEEILARQKRIWGFC